MRFSLNLEINSGNGDLLRLRRLYDLDQLLALTRSAFPCRVKRIRYFITTGTVTIVI